MPDDLAARGSNGVGRFARRAAYLAIALSVLWGPGVLSTPAQETVSAHDVLSRSIAYHDPDGEWFYGSYRIELAGTRPLAGPTLSIIIIDNVAGRFHLQRDRFGARIESDVTGDECWTRLNGSSDLTDQQIERFGLSCEQMRSSRNYYTYLYGLPMKLRDPGTILDPEAERTQFQGRDAWSIRVTYDPEVGGDTWYFYFDPQSWALIGYRFYHDEAANDGEYIVLEREASGGGVVLPKVRTWYTHGDERLLGTDTIRSIDKLSAPIRQQP